MLKNRHGVCISEIFKPQRVLNFPRKYRKKTEQEMGLRLEQRGGRGLGLAAPACHFPAEAAGGAIGKAQFTFSLCTSSLQKP